MARIDTIFGQGAHTEVVDHPQQGYLNLHMYALADIHKRVLNNPIASVPPHLAAGMLNQNGTGYANLKLVDGGAHPAAFLQKLMSFTGIYDFLNLEPWMAALLVPKIRIYRQFESTLTDNTVKHEIRFAQHWGSMSEGVPGGTTFDHDMAAISDAAVTEVGIKDFTFDDIGQHPDVGGRVFETRLTLYAKSLQALSRHQGTAVLQDDGETNSHELHIPVRASDLLFPCTHIPAIFDSEGNLLPTNNSGTQNTANAKTLIRIGWELNPNHQVELSMGRGTSYLNTALAVMQQEFELYFSKYDISFNEDGSCDISIDFAANMQEREVNNVTDVLSGDNSWRSRLEGNRDRDREIALGSELAHLATFQSIARRMTLLPAGLRSALEENALDLESMLLAAQRWIRENNRDEALAIEYGGQSVSFGAFMNDLNAECLAIMPVLVAVAESTTGLSESVDPLATSGIDDGALRERIIYRAGQMHTDRGPAIIWEDNGRTSFRTMSSAYGTGMGQADTDLASIRRSVESPSGESDRQLVTILQAMRDNDVIADTMAGSTLQALYDIDENSGIVSDDAGGMMEMEKVNNKELQSGLGYGFITLMYLAGGLKLDEIGSFNQSGGQMKMHYGWYLQYGAISGIESFLDNVETTIQTASSITNLGIADDERTTLYNWIIGDLTAYGKMYYSGVSLLDFYNGREMTSQQVVGSLQTVDITDSSEEETYLGANMVVAEDFDWDDINEAQDQYIREQNAFDLMEERMEFYVDDVGGESVTYDTWYAYADHHNIEYEIPTTADTEAESWEKRVYFVYLGDILEAIYRNQGRRDISLVIGSFYFAEGADPINLCDIPISLQMFTSVWFELTENYDDRSLPIQTFIGAMMKSVNKNIVAIQKLDGSDLPGISFGVKSYIDRRVATCPHQADTTFAAWWPKYSNGSNIRLNAASSQFNFPIPFTSDDLDFTSMVYVYGTAAKPPGALTGDADADMLQAGWRESPNSDETATGVDSYYENFGPIYHLTYGADKGIVKALNFGTINNASLATYFVMQDYNNEDAPDGAYDYRTAENSELVAAEEALAERNEPSSPQRYYDDEEYLLDREGGSRVSPLQTKAQVERQEHVESFFANSQDMQMVQLIHKMDVTLLGTSLFKNGTYVYIDPTLPGVASGYNSITSNSPDGMATSPEIASAMGIGGYYLITKVSGKIGDGIYEVEVEGMLEAGQNAIRQNIANYEGE
jgi:hypothetical protein